jgi:hypothetical protein
MLTQIPDYVQVSTTISSFMKRFEIGKLLKLCNAYKEKGVPAVRLFLFMLQKVFSDRSMYMQMKTGRWNEEFGKNTYYRFLNSAKVNWERFTRLLAARIIREAIQPLTSEERKDVFIVDDTLYRRTGYKKTELCAKVFDHTDMKYRKGFRALTLGWSDGNTFVPISHRLLSAAKDENVLGPEFELDGRTLAARRRKQARSKATDVMVAQLRDALQSGIRAKYVLFDSWFSAPKQILELKEMGLDTIAMVKKSSKINYLWQDEKLNIKQIYSRNRKRPGRSRYLLSVDVTVGQSKDGEPVEAKIVCVRNRSNRKDWLAILCTDITLSEEEIIRLYGKRWDIEVFFKTCKSYLKLLTECHSLSYDALTAHTSVVLVRYMLLALEQRKFTDNRSFGELFMLLVDELADITFSHSMQLIVAAMLDSIREVFRATDEQIEKLMEAFLSRLPEDFRTLLSAA